MEQCGRELDSFGELVQKAVNAKAKTALWPRFAACETDQRCPQSTRPAHFTVAKANLQDSSMKNPRIEEPEARTQKTTLQRSNSPEISKLSHLAYL